MTKQENAKVELIKRLMKNGIDAYIAKERENASWAGFLEHVAEVAARQKEKSDG